MHTFINGAKAFLVFLVCCPFFFADITGRCSLDKLPEPFLFETKIVVVALLVDCLTVMSEQIIQTILGLRGKGNFS